MTHALVEVYASTARHLDAYAIADLVPDAERRRWVPELETEALLLQRVFLAEKWLVARLHYGHVDPREAGVGNIVNCGAAMYMAPVGIVNAGDPAGAYAEAIDVAGAHQSSYGREAAGVFAAAVAAAMTAGRNGASVVRGRARRSPATARGAAIEAVGRRGGRAHRLARGDSRAARRRSSPYDTVGPSTTGPGAGRAPAEPRPSRSRSCRSRSASCWSPAATYGRGPGRRELRPGRGLDRDDGRRDRRRAGGRERRPGRVARTRSPTASRLDLSPRARRWPAVAREICRRRTPGAPAPAGTCGPASSTAGEEPAR